MRMKLRMCLLVLLSFSVSACTSMRPVSVNTADFNDASQIAIDDLQVGDNVSLTTTDGVTHTLIVGEVNDQLLRGAECEDCNSVSIPITSIDSLYVKRVSVVKTTSVSVLVGLVILIAATDDLPLQPGL